MQMPKTRGASALSTFLETNGLTHAECAKAIGIARSTMHNWLNGILRPREAHQRAVEVWTNGAVPVSWWLTDEERAEIAEIKPFQPGSELPQRPTIDESREPRRKPRRSRAAA
jgi:transcriptional regulator with XRE-family HTH domain